MTISSSELILIPEINSDIDELTKILTKSGVTFSHTKNDSVIPEFQVHVPNGVHLLIPGNFLNFKPLHNVPVEKTCERNNIVFGLVSALALKQNVSVLIGANEADAMGIITRDDYRPVKSSVEVQLGLRNLCALGFMSHAAKLTIDQGLSVEDSIFARRKGFELYSDFVATSGGMTYKLWEKIGMPKNAQEVVDRLNDDLVRVAKRLVEKNPGAKVDSHVPETLSASRYVQRSGYSTIPSPLTTHTNELHKDWYQAWSPNPGFGQLRFNMSIFVDPITFRGSEFSYEQFRLGKGDISYPGIVARLSPIISLNPADRKVIGIDHGMISFEGKIEPNLAVSEHARALKVVCEQGQMARVLAKGPAG